MEKNDQDGEGEITFIVEENEKHEWIEIYADVDPDQKKHECEIKFIFSTKGTREGFIFSFRTKDNYYDSNQKEVTPARLIAMNGIQAKIFRLYSAQVKITNYNEYISNSWDRY